MDDKILTVLDSILNKAFKLDVDEIELFAQRKTEKKVFLESNFLKSAITSRLEGVGVRVIRNKSLGFVSVNSFNKSKILEGIKEAIAIAKVTPQEIYNHLPNKQITKEILDLFDTSFDSFTMDDLISIGDNCLSRINDIDSRINIESAEFRATKLETAIINSNGIENSETKSNYSWDIAGMAIDGNDIGSWDIVSDSVTKAKDIDMESSVNKFSKKVLGNLNAKKIDSFVGTMILSPDAAFDLLSIVIDSASAYPIQQGGSYLQDKLGDKIAINDFSIIDNGSLRNSSSSSSFDREGLPHKELKIIDKGIFTGILYNSLTANKENIQSTGHASGDFRSIPQIAATNLSILAGNKTIDNLISEIDKGIYVKRVSTSPDYVSGDFSAVLKGSHLIKNGEKQNILKEITATGNIYNCLEEIIALSKELFALRYGYVTFTTPIIAINNINFAS